jgi:uncharacterized phage protein gp47/JayE
MQYDKDKQDTLARATTVTTEDIRKSKTSKSVVPPANMDGLLHLLNCYRKSLLTLCGLETASGHGTYLHYTVNSMRANVKWETTPRLFCESPKKQRGH